MLRARQSAVANAVVVHIFVAGEPSQTVQIFLGKHFAAVDWYLWILEGVGHPVIHPQIQIRHYEHQSLELLGEIECVLRHAETLSNGTRKQEDILGIAV